MLSANAYSVIGIYLTLVGLLGTFFYVHLGNWLGNLLKLKVKWDLNKRGTDADQKAAIRECKYELKGLYNHVPIMLSSVVSLFLFVLSFYIWSLLQDARADPLAESVKEILLVFLILYGTLTLYLVCRGLCIGHSISRGLDAQ